MALTIAAGPGATSMRPGSSAQAHAVMETLEELPGLFGLEPSTEGAV